MNNNNSIPKAAAKRGGFNSAEYDAIEKCLDQPTSTTSTSTTTTTNMGGASYAQTMQQVEHLRKLARTWRSPPIMLLVAKSFENNDDIISVDITKTIDTNTTRRVPRAGKRDDSNCYWLCKNLSKDDVICAIKNACRLAGFKAKCHYYESYSSAGKPSDTGWLEVKCSRCEFHDEEKNKAHNEKKRSTSEYTKGKGKGLTENKKKSLKPVKGMEGHDELCPVCFKIYFDVHSNRWFVWKGQKGEIVHQGHKQREPLDIRLETKYLLTEEDDELADQTAKSFISTAATKSLMETRHEDKVLGVSYQQLYHRQRKKEKELEDKQATLATSCDKLVHYLTVTEDISWVGLFADPTTNLLSIRKKKSKDNRALAVEQLSEDSLCGDETDNPKQYVQGLKERKSLIHTESGQLLIAVAFTCDSQRKLFDMRK